MIIMDINCQTSQSAQGIRGIQEDISDVVLLEAKVERRDAKYSTNWFISFYVRWIQPKEWQRNSWLSDCGKGCLVKDFRIQDFSSRQKIVRGEADLWIGTSSVSDIFYQLSFTIGSASQDWQASSSLSQTRLCFRKSAVLLESGGDPMRLP